MRIVKLSGNVFGFDTLDGCKAYFEHVLPWQKGQFYFAGTGNKVALDKLQPNENVIFTYEGTVVCITKAENLLIENGKATGIKLRIDILKMFKSHISSLDLEDHLKSYGFTDCIYASQGWNIIGEPYEQHAIQFLKDQEWNVYNC
jgi:hypothetical protein